MTWSLHESRSVGSVYFSRGVLDLPGSLNPSSPSSTGVPLLCLVFDCGSLHLFPVAARWSLSDGNWAGQWSMTTAEYHQNISLIFFPVMFGSSLWAVQTLGSGLSGSIRKEFALVVWVSSHWLATPIISKPPLPQHILEAGQTVG